MKITRTVQMIEKLDKVGRNDPCPCGSTKKYKKCHMLIASPDEFFSPSLTKGFIAKLLDFSTGQAWYEKAFKNTFYEIFGHDKKEVDEKEMQAFSEVILFEIKVYQKKTPLELFVQQAPLSARERKIYEAWLDSGIFGAFEVIDVVLGKGMRVKSFGKTDEFVVSEQMGSYGAKTGDVLVLRVLPFEKGYMFGGGVFMKLPEAWLYEMKRKKIPFDLSALEFLKILHGKKDKRDTQHKSYEMLKKELFEIIRKEEMPFALDGFDKNIKKAKNPNIFFYPLYKTCFEQPDLGEKVMKLTIDLWQSAHQNTDYSEDEIAVGPIETVLLREFMEYCGRQFEKEQIIDPAVQIERSIVWKKEWLARPKKALNFRTPQEAILAERKERGNTKTSFDFNTTSFFAPKSRDKADVLQVKGIKASSRFDYRKARQYYSEIVEHYPDYPFIYRSIANLGMCYVALGDKKKGLELLQTAKEMNPNYRFARKQYEIVAKLSPEKIAEQAGALHMQKAMERLLAMFKRTKERKRTKSSKLKA